MRRTKHEFETYFEEIYLKNNHRSAKLNWEECENCEDHFERFEQYLNRHSNNIEILLNRY